VEEEVQPAWSGTLVVGDEHGLEAFTLSGDNARVVHKGQIKDPVTLLSSETSNNCFKIIF
jgi:hypothetical protein